MTDTPAVPADREVERVAHAINGWVLAREAVSAERDGYRVQHGCVAYGRLYDTQGEALTEMERLRALSAIAAMQPAGGEGVVPMPRKATERMRVMAFVALEAGASDAVTLWDHIYGALIAAAPSTGGRDG